MSGALLFPMDGGSPRHGDLYVEGDAIAAVCRSAAPVDASAPADATGASRACGANAGSDRLGAAGASKPPIAAGAPDPSGSTQASSKRDDALTGQPFDPVPAWASEAEHIPCEGLWILPGFVQTHVHLCQSLFRGMAEGRTLFEWLSEVIWPGEAALDEDSIEVSAEFGLQLAMAAGTTTILDMGTTQHTDGVARAVARSGIRAFLGPALMDRGPDAAMPLLRELSAARTEIDQLAMRWHGHDDRIQIALCPRFVPSVSDEMWRDIVRAPEYRGFPIHTHASETREEVETVRALAGGATPPQVLARPDGAAGRLKIAHAVWITDDDRKVMAAAGASVAHCPSSNLKLGSGLADVRALRDAGVRVGLGADGAACNNRLDPFQEMRNAAAIESVTRGPAGVDAARILWMATRGGAEVLDLDAQLGSLRAGQKADFVILDPASDPAGALPALAGETPEAWLVWAGSSILVRETWVAGTPVWTRAGFAAWLAEWEPKIREARQRIWSAICGEAESRRGS